MPFGQMKGIECVNIHNDLEQRKSSVELMHACTSIMHVYHRQIKGLFEKVMTGKLGSDCSFKCNCLMHCIICIISANLTIY